jgi:hypothetical protein
MAEVKEPAKPLRLDNLLAKWLIPSPLCADNNTDPTAEKPKPKPKLRAFSHLAGSPADVERWVVVKLERLGDPVLFDARSCDAMHQRDVSFVVSPDRKPVAVLHAVYVSSATSSSSSSS